MNLKLFLCVMAILPISSVNCMSNALLEDYKQLDKCVQSPLNRDAVKETYQSVIEKLKEEIRKLKSLMHKEGMDEDVEEDGDEDESDRLQTTVELYESYLYDLSSEGKRGQIISREVDGSIVKSFEELKQEIEDSK